MLRKKVYFPDPAVQLGTSLSDIYTCTALNDGEGGVLIFVNTSASDVAVTAHIVRSGDTAGAKNILVDAENVVAHQHLRVAQFPGMAFEPGDKIQAKASAATAISPHGVVTETRNAL